MVNKVKKKKNLFGQKLFEIQYKKLRVRVPVRYLICLHTLTSKMRWTSGIEKAPVLPEPVLPLANRSFPSISRGMALS
jgi:hypothetical protein